jgi:hypothetical protein
MATNERWISKDERKLYVTLIKGHEKQLSVTVDPNKRAELEMKINNLRRDLRFDFEES